MYIGQIENAAVPITAINNGLAAALRDDPTTTIMNGVELSKKIMKTLKEAVESSTILKEITAEINRIQLVNNYLEAHERNMVTNTKLNLARAENEFSYLRLGK